MSYNSKNISNLFSVVLNEFNESIIFSKKKRNIKKDVVTEAEIEIAILTAVSNEFNVPLIFLKKDSKFYFKCPQKQIYMSN